MSLELPSGNEWTLDDRGPAWWIATHGPTSSELAVRTWRAARTVSTTDCLAEARLRGPRHFQEPAESLDSRALAAPEGFTGEVVLGVTDAGGHLEGRLQAVGRAAGRCFALGFVTVAEGPRAPALVGGRLAAIAEVVAPSVRILGPDDRVE